ncbi:hypothetical protein GGR56DRAFT_624185 [Xylariaceae sp. FL0804]|nr:hypothetical protein GGR56DRAFT_624185 [Xylariaceae sp. FL0804]
MTTSLYNQSVPVLTHYVKVFEALLNKAEAFAVEKGIKPEDMIQHSLAPDMEGLALQVQCVGNYISLYLERVSQRPHVTVADDETTFDQLRARLARTVDYLGQFDAEALDGAADKPLKMETAKMGSFHWESAQSYLSYFVIPAVYFRLTNAYCILRHQGMPLNVRDYFGDIFKPIQ